MSRVGFEMGFFRNRDFLFWAKSKNPDNPGITIGIWKSRKKNPENPEIPEIGIGILKPLKNPEKIPSAKSRKSQNPGDRDSFSLGIFIPEIRNFFQSRDFYPGHSGFFSISGFYPRDFRKIPEIYAKFPGFGIFYLRDNPGILYPQDFFPRDFFVG